jgi:crotonobetainyl-CoA:carnitine CoA-transferase CaiB-like acyl-CoA transferase
MRAKRPLSAYQLPVRSTYVTMRPYRSLGLDLRNEKGKEIVRELVKVSDILI